MKSRIVSSVVLIVLFLTVIYFAKIPLVLSLSVALLSAAALYETLIVTKYIESRILMWLSIALSLLIPFLGQIFAFLPFRKMISTSLISCIFVYVLIIIISMLVSKEKFSLEHLSFVFLMTIIIPCFFSTIIYANTISGKILNVLFIFLCAWGSDTGGYIFGNFFGRHKIAPNISPKKTFEGVIGCIASSAVSVIVLCYISDIIYDELAVNYLAAVIYGLLGGICAILGDLFASVIKRSFGVKDFGSIIPGHGGIMDRFDSVLFTAPLIYIMISVLPVFLTV